MILFIKSLYWKYKIKKLNFKIRGENIIIKSGIDVYDANNISLGDDIYIGDNLKVYGYGNVIIGNNTILGPDVKIMTSNHNYNLNPEYIPYDSKNIIKDVIIGENVWIGANVIILPGVVIEEGVVIGMGSVVTKSVPKCAVIGGNPAKIIKFREISLYESLKDSDRLYMKSKRNLRV